jgi:hypothetical protein
MLICTGRDMHLLDASHFDSDFFSLRLIQNDSSVGHETD